MFKKDRIQTEELKVMTALDSRGDLAENEKQQLLSLVKGFDGELQFDAWLSKLEAENIVLNDLLFEVNGSTFQIDSSIIMHDRIYIFEVKNYEGEFYFEGDKLKTLAGTEYKNPIIQLKRTESLLRQLLNNHGFNLHVEAYVIFINPEFTLFNAPADQPLLLPSQLNRFFKKINKISSKLNNRHKLLADKLLSLHLHSSPYSRQHEYDYSKLKKGIKCPSCQAIMEDYQWPNISCRICSTTEHIEAAIMRNIAEYKLLFPERKITANDIYDWCGFVVPKRFIQKILKRNYKIMGFGQWSYYV